MKKITIIAVGKFKEDFLNQAIQEYKKRLTRFCKLNIIELPSSNIKNESELLKNYNIDFLLDINGELISSVSFSKLIDNHYVLGFDNITFAIGGSDGVDDNIKSLAKRLISFGKVTYPHQLMRVILLEQIYRSFTILSNMPYHK